MRALILDEKAKADAARLRAYALAHPESLHDLTHRGNRTDLAPGNKPEFTMHLPDGWRVVLTVEAVLNPPGMFAWHFSVSVDVRDPKLPCPQLLGVQAILRLLDLPPMEKRIGSHIEGNAINLWFACYEILHPGAH
jgi:hypothetical protein